MAAKKSAKKAAKKSPKSASATRNVSQGFSDEERAAMRERAKELKAARAGKGDDEGAVLAKIAAMPQPDRAMAERLHAIILAAAPGLAPRQLQHLQLRPDALGQLGQFMTIHAGHVDIRDEDGDVLILLEPVECIPAALGADRVATEIFQHGHEHVEDGGIVVND